MDNTSKDRSYYKGFNDGKNGGMMDDLVQRNKHLIPIPDHPDESSYDAGYKDGIKARGNENNSQSQDGGKRKDMQPTQKKQSSPMSSTQYSSRYKPPPSNNEVIFQLAKVVGILGAIIAIVYFTFYVFIPFVVVDFAIVAFAAGFVKKDWQQGLFFTAFATGFYTFLDYDGGWVTKYLEFSLHTPHVIILGIVYVNILAGAVGMFLLCKELLGD
jgi:hypothetical protein